MQFKCYSCDWVYDESDGDAKTDLPPMTKHEDIPADWICLRCKEQGKLTDFMLKYLNKTVLRPVE
tara:strand:- start:317 stop:511 length:195 start_codon:yes stop_codon:yes gene_type:complete